MKFKMIGVLAAVALLGACADKAATSGAATGSGASSRTAGVTPGSQQDLVANIGDRVFYDLDSSSLSGEARSTLAGPLPAVQRPGGRQLRRARHDGV